MKKNVPEVDIYQLGALRARLQFFDEPKNWKVACMRDGWSLLHAYRLSGTLSDSNRSRVYFEITRLNDAYKNILRVKKEEESRASGQELSDRLN